MKANNLTVLEDLPTQSETKNQTMVMHQDNFALLQEEALRLINIESQFLSEMLDVTGLVLKEQKENKQTFDQTSVKKTVEILDGESKKLANQELVLAVVGTMKAGKSTTINAIVGTEILPNRNRPMTALPTLIRHKPGQKEPVLRLQNNQPLNNYLQQLQGVLAKKSVDASAYGAENEEDMKKLIENIKYVKSFKTEIHGKRGIYDFLKMLNDLVRLSVVTKTPFPFTNYNKVDELPVIEVEFAHLEQYQSQVGQLTLLDTPGPNEAGQEHLKPMLTDQLKKASAILTVLDYTQLKSDADATVRKELQDIADECKDRLFVLVNKFDQRDRNADSAVQVKNYVAGHLMAGAIDSKVVYPVSANRAYLASRAQTEIELHDKLDISQSWVEDFGKIAFGEDWQDDIHNSDQVLKKAAKVWKKAGFATPLQEVISQSYQKAGIISLNAAAVKINKTAADLENFLEVRNTGLKTSTETLKAQIENLKQDISRLTSLTDQTQHKLKDSATKLESTCKDEFESMHNRIMRNLDNYFKEGKAKENSQKEQSNNKGNKNKNKNNSDFDPKSPKIEFESESDAKELLNKISSSLNTIVSTSVKGLEPMLKDEMQRFDSYLNKEVRQDCESLLASVQADLEKNNFNLVLKMPNINVLSSLNMLSDIQLDNAKERSKTVTRQRRQSGVWGTVCRWLDTDDWGWESYQATKHYFEVDIDQIKQGISQGLNQKLEQTQNNILEIIVDPLTSQVDNLFTELSQTVESIRNDLLQSIGDHKKSQAEQEELLRYLAGFVKQARKMHTDSEGLVGDVEQLFVLDSSEALA
ncbi:dynamin family protein [Vibrio metschnikovii]|uniref:dynamin family protein n=1 Tax=Vibrio metschnikovii TaxID=28172 RepID=UPI002FCA49B2